MNPLRMFVFRLYEQRELRNWFYTVAFLIFVPVGYRFASLAWRYGSWEDKPLAVIAGIFIGITAAVTLMRVWQVPPRQVVTLPAPPPMAKPTPVISIADQFLAATRRRAAENWSLASAAGSLGSTLGRGLRR